MDLKLKDKRVLITGGTGGLGQEMVRAFLRAGARVVTNYREDETAAQSLMDSVRGDYPGRLIVRQYNVASQEVAVELVRFAERELGGLDVLVNNAGVMDPKEKDVYSFDDKDFDRTFHTNVRGLIYVTRMAIKIMIKNRKGNIVNMSSAGVYTANPKEVFYAGSKAAVEAATRSFAAIGAPHGVTVNAVAPHLCEAGMALEKALDPERIAKIPMLRPGKPEEVAALVLFLSSEVSSYITGTVVSIDGGRPLRR
jgi:3-oxoacyl-[acyl-carrier protein] reductase